MLVFAWLVIILSSLFFICWMSNLLNASRFPVLTALCLSCAALFVDIICLLYIFKPEIIPQNFVIGLGLGISTICVLNYLGMTIDQMVYILPFTIYLIALIFFTLATIITVKPELSAPINDFLNIPMEWIKGLISSILKNLKNFL